MQGVLVETVLGRIQKEGHEKANQICFVNSIHDEKVDWTLGASMYINNKNGIHEG